MNDGLIPADRREFLKGSAALALAGVAPAGPSALAEGSPVRVAVVGTGARGSDLIRALATIDGAELVAICDDYGPHLERARIYAGRSPEPFTDYEAMLRKASPQAVVVAVPLDLHHDFCLRAIDRGCAVFCEKMMCRTVEEAADLARRVEARKTVFQVGLQRRVNAIYRQAKAMVAAGMLGRVTAIKAQWNRNHSWRRPVPVPRDHPDWPKLDDRLNWRLYRARSEGLLAELGSHQLDVANSLLGTTPRRVIGSGGIDHYRDGREVHDNVWCVYEYTMEPTGRDPMPAGSEDGAYTVRVSYSSMQTNAYEGASELVLGTKGTLFLTPAKGLFFREWGAASDPMGERSEKLADQAEKEAAVVTSGKTLKLSHDPWAHRGKPFEIDATGDDTREELLMFLDCARRGDPATPCGVRDGLINTATVLMGTRALETGLPVAWSDLLDSPERPEAQ